MVFRSFISFSFPHCLQNRRQTKSLYLLSHTFVSLWNDGQFVLSFTLAVHASQCVVANEATRCVQFSDIGRSPPNKGTQILRSDRVVFSLPLEHKQVVEISRLTPFKTLRDFVLIFRYWSMPFGRPHCISFTRVVVLSPSCFLVQITNRLLPSLWSISQCFYMIASSLYQSKTKDFFSVHEFKFEN